MQNSHGIDFPDLSRCNRILIHGDPTNDGLLPGDLRYLSAEQRMLSRRGLWLVLRYSMSAGRYQVLHFDSLGRRHMGWVNVGEIEADECFVPVS